MGGPGRASVENKGVDSTGAPMLPGEVPRSILDMFGAVGSGQNAGGQAPATPGAAVNGGIPFNYNTRGMNFNQMRVQQESANAAKPATPMTPAVPSPKPPFSHDPSVRGVTPRPFEFGSANPYGGAQFVPNVGLSNQNQLAGASSK